MHLLSEHRSALILVSVKLCPISHQSYNSREIMKILINCLKSYISLYPILQKIWFEHLCSLEEFLRQIEWTRRIHIPLSAHQMENRMYILVFLKKKIKHCLAEAKPYWQFISIKIWWNENSSTWVLLKKRVKGRPHMESSIFTYDAVNLNFLKFMACWILKHHK